MFDSLSSKIITAIIALIIEYYCFTAIRVSTRDSSPKYKFAIRVIYIAFTLFIWYLLLTFWNWSVTQSPSTWKALKTALALGTLLAKVLTTLFMIIGDIFVGIKAVFFRKKLIATEIKSLPSQETHNPQNLRHISRSKFISRLSILMGGLLLGGITYGVKNRYRYKLVKVKIPLKDLPDEFEGFKFAQISDIHSGSFDNHEDVQKGVDMVMNETPELILFTGDLVNSRALEIEPFMDIFKQLKAPMGVYATTGNHDYGHYYQWKNEQEAEDNFKTLLNHEAEMGFKMLHNQHVILEKGKGKIALIGVDNWGSMKRFPKLGDLHKACAGIPADIKTKILMSHDPSHWDAKVRPQYPDINLTLSGHTHGMQLGIEIPGFIKWSPIQYVYKQWAGLYKENEQLLYVNRGFGFLGYQGRLGILPEITVFELVKA